MKRKRLHWFGGFLLGLLCVWCHVTSAEAPPYRILYINSYHRGYLWSDGIEQGLRERFTASGKPVDLYVEFLDTQRFPDLDYFDSLAEALALKHGKVQYDVIIVSDNNAFNFATRYREQLFPDVPLVFCGYNAFRPEVIAGMRNLTGVNEEVDFTGTIDMALALQPATERLVFITSDYYASGKKNQERVEAELIPAYQARYEVIQLKNLRLHEIEQRLAALPPRSLVFVFGEPTDNRDAQFIAVSEYYRRVAAVSPVPAYSFWDFTLNTGITGGSIVTGPDQGHAAADMALQILAGTPADAIPVRMETPTSKTFDFNALRRFGIAEKSLPPGSQILNRPDTFYHRYALYLWLAGAIFALLMALVLVLMVSLRNSRRLGAQLRVEIGERQKAVVALQQQQEHLEEVVAERTTALRQTNLRLEREIAERTQIAEQLRFQAMLLAQIQDSIIATDLEGRITYVNDAVVHKLGRSRAELIGATVAVLGENPAKGVTQDEIIQQTLQHGVWQGQVVNYSQQHEEIILDAHTSLLYNVEGQAAGMVGISTDVTAKVQVEEALRASERLYHQMFAEHTAIKLLIAPISGGIVDANAAAAQFYGYSVATLRTMTIDQINTLPHEQIAAAHDAILTHRQNYFTFQHRLATGEIRDVEVHSIPIQTGERVLLYSIIHDITARKQAEEVLRLRLELLEYATTHSLEELMQTALDEIGELTGSPIGFYHFVEEDQKTLRLQAWSTRTKQEFCKVEGQGLHYGIDQAGVWVDCVYQRKPVIHNDYASLPHRKGMPPGHAAVLRELVVPTLREGRIVSILGVGNKAVDYDEKDVELVAYVADIIWSIVERKRTEEQLQHYQRQLEAQNLELRKLSLAIEQSGNTIIITDMDGVIQYVNPRFEQTTGYTRQESLGKTPRILKSGEQSVAYYQELWGAITQGRTWRGEFRNRRKDGALYWESTTIAPIQDDVGQIIHYIAVKEDITARKQADAALREKTEELDRFFSLALDLLCIADTSGYFRRLNQAWEKTLGYSLADLEGHKFLDFIHPDDMPATLAALGKLEAGQEILDFVNRYRCKDGSYRWIEWRAAPYGNLIYAAARDITERKRMEDALRQAKDAAEAANRAKSAFLANMSHELRTPLNAVLGFSELLTHDSNLTAQQRENLAIIERSGDHLLALINDVLDFSKIEAGRVEVQMEPFDLHEMLLGLGEMFSLSARQKGLSLIFNFASDVPQYVCAEQHKLRQVLINLLGNAVKFTARGGIIMAVEKQEALPGDRALLEGVSAAPLIRLRFEIKDTGMGIAPDEMDGVFEAFVQTSSGQLSQQGTGLGLPISREYVRMMGGNLTLQSEVGVGSTFTFDMQAEVVDAARVAAMRPAYKVTGLEPGQPIYRILVAEDDDASRELLVKYLLSLGVEVSEARNGAEALTLWQNWRPHLIFMDMRMPKVDGQQATREIKAQTRQSDLKTAIIALTASAFEEDRDSFLAAGCDDFVRKPFRETTIVEILARHLGVRFIYARSAGPTPSVIEMAHSLIDSEQLSMQVNTLDPQWIATMRQATVEGDLKWMEALVAQIRDQAPALAGQLAQLLYNFEHDGILDLLQSNST